MQRLSHSKTRIFFVAISILLLGLFIFRLLLPYAIKETLNKRFNRIPNYQGKVESVDVHLWRGAYQINNLIIDKTEGGVKQPFIKIPVIDLSINWKALLKGNLVAEVFFDEPELTFVFSKAEKKQTIGKGGDWQATLQSLMPITINRIVVRNGTFEFLQFPIETAADQLPDLRLYQTNMIVTNLTNAKNDDDKLPSTMTATATIGNVADFKTRIDFDILDFKNKWSISGFVRELNLPNINDLAKQYLSLDFQNGKLDVFFELAVVDTELQGYIKLLGKDVEVFDLSEDNDSPIEFIWEAVSGLLVNIFQNQPKDQFAVRVPFSGTIMSTDEDILSAIGSILKNAIIEAMKPGIEDSVHLDELEPEDDS